MREVHRKRVWERHEKKDRGNEAINKKNEMRIMKSKEEKRRRDNERRDQKKDKDIDITVTFYL